MISLQEWSRRKLWAGIAENRFRCGRSGDLEKFALLFTFLKGLPVRGRSRYLATSSCLELRRKPQDDRILLIHEPGLVMEEARMVRGVFKKRFIYLGLSFYSSGAIMDINTSGSILFKNVFHSLLL